MKRNPILAVIAYGAGLVLCPALQAQDARPGATASGAGALKKPADDVTRTPCWECHRWLEPHRLENLTVDLALTADQQTQVKPILSKFHAQDHTTKQDASLSQQQKAARFKDAWDAANTQINAVLAPAQREKFALVKDQYPNQRHGENSQPSQSPAVTLHTN